MGARRQQNSARKDLKKSSSPCDCPRAAVAVGEILSGSVCQQWLEAEAAGDRPVGRWAACSRVSSGTVLVPVLLPHGGLGRSKPPGSGAVRSTFAPPSGLEDSCTLRGALDVRPRSPVESRFCSVQSVHRGRSPVHPSPVYPSLPQVQ